MGNKSIMEGESSVWGDSKGEMAENAARMACVIN